jgi:hypothetical protein
MLILTVFIPLMIKIAVLLINNIHKYVRFGVLMAVNMEIMLVGIVWYIGTNTSRFRVAGTWTRAVRKRMRDGRGIFSFCHLLTKFTVPTLKPRFSFIRYRIKKLV